MASHTSNTLRQSIVCTVAYFDLFEYPLTPFEVWKWLWSEGGKSASYYEVEQALEREELTPALVRSGAFVTLRGREQIVATRRLRHRLSIAKLRRAHRVARFLSYIPWIEGIAVCNSLGYRNARATSDIDFFVVTTPGALWLTRLLATTPVAILGLRPRLGATTDGICLSFFVTRDALNLQALTKPELDPYLTYWVTTLIPLYGRGDVWNEFSLANAWIKKFLPNALAISTGPHWLFRSAPRRLSSRLSLARWLDKRLQRLQMQRLPAPLQEIARRSTTDVVLGAQMIKLHENDRRTAYRERWRSLLLSVGVTS